MLLVSAAAVPLTPQVVPSQLGATNYAVDQPMVRSTSARLVWSDEFDGSEIDRSRWQFDTSRNKAGWYNGEQQYYADGRHENVRVEHGHLIVEARHETLPADRYPDWGGQAYTSAKLVTKGRASWTYGFYEVRAKLPCARGTWPAIWMLPDTGTWPAGGEIDVLEQVGSEPNVAHATLHTELFTHSKGTQRGATTTVPTSCAAYHRYQLDWRPDSITIGVDDKAYMRVRNDQPGGRGAWPFDRPFHMILNLAIGGAWAGSKGTDDAAMPQRMEVDYVRVWQEPR
jgi:beta-glucanase (GH16 family)